MPKVILNWKKTGKFSLNGNNLKINGKANESSRFYYIISLHKLSGKDLYGTAKKRIF